MLRDFIDGILITAAPLLFGSISVHVAAFLCFSNFFPQPFIIVRSTISSVAPTQNP